MVVVSSLLLRDIYLSSLGAIFLVAFWSFYIQFPGLLSSSGLEPVQRLFPQVLSPWLYQYLFVATAAGKIVVVDEDSLCELLALAGMMLSCVAMVGLVHHGVLFFFLTLVYGFLARVGGTFYSFQWDTLLVETGAVTALCYAPWLRLAGSYYTLLPPMNKKRKQQHLYSSNPNCSSSPIFSLTLGAWPLRFLLFKLMFLSGLVKIQSDCPTWRQLTALEYHFATQCLPGPLAWHAHQLPPHFLRLGVAATLWIEIPVAVFLVLPWTFLRRIAAALQVALQVLIILTGNYNFFNLLTMALCLPCFARDDEHEDEDAINKNKKTRRWLAMGQYFTAAILLIGTFGIMFRIQLSNPTFDWWHGFQISLHLSKLCFMATTERLLPWIVNFLILYVMAQGARRAVSIRRSVWLLLLEPVHLLVCVVVIGVIAIHMLNLTDKLYRNGFLGSRFCFQHLWHNYAMPYRASNSYGLFRRMTGMGRSDDNHSVGWAGLPPSVVARPEIIFEAMFQQQNNKSSSTDETWRELRFRWKPGHARIRPQQVAPHQPRLDWQMWFAALGEPQHNPWLLHLVKMLLDGCEVVVELVGDPRLLRGRKLKRLRAKLYHYDFTRLDTEWNRKIPNAKFVILSNRTNSVSNLMMGPDQYWTRTLVSEYLPPLEKNNELLQRYVEAHGYRNTCVAYKDRCRARSSLLCQVVTSIRLNRLYSILVSSVLAMAAARLIQATKPNGKISLAKKNQ